MYYTHLFDYRGYQVVSNEHDDILVRNPSGDFYDIRLDDSKSCGYRKYVQMSKKEQMETSKRYIDWVISCNS